MIKFKTIKSKNDKLKPYIEEYVSLNISDEKLNSKDLIPKPGAILLFTSKPILLKEKILPHSLLMGILTEPLSLGWNKNGYGFFVKFSSYGLSRFLNIPIYKLTDRIIASQNIWGKSLKALQNQILESSSLDKQVELVENFLINKFIEPSSIEKKIFQLADKLKNDFNSSDIKNIKDNFSLSTRQLERKFKDLIGVNIQTFNRICRFDRAINKMKNRYKISLTYIGYDSGYFDQSHYSREFKRMTRYSPKNFFKNALFYQRLFKPN